MISCPNCGLENNDYDEVCSVCGTVLNADPVKDNKKVKRGSRQGFHTRNGKKLWVVMVAIAVLAGLGIGGALIVRGLSADAALLQAAGKTAVSFAGSVTSEDEFVSGGSKILALLDKGEYTLSMAYENHGLVVDTDFDYSQKKKLMSGSADIYMDGFSFSANYSVDDDLLLVSSPIGMENVYGVDLDELEKGLRTSPLGALLPKEIAELINIDFFKKTDLNSLMRADGNKELKVLLRSAKIKYLDERVVTGVNTSVPCKMYQVTWDEEKAKDLISSLKEKGGMANVAAFLAAVVLKLDPDARCYVNENKELVGVDLVSAGVRYEFLLEGDKNPWDQFSLTITTLSGMKDVFMGEISNSIDGTVCYLKNDQITYLTLTLTEKGEFALDIYGKGTVLYGNFTSVNNGAEVDITVDSEEFGATRVAYKISELKNAPQPLTKHYIDILDMDLSDLQRFLFDLGLLVS